MCNTVHLLSFISAVICVFVFFFCAKLIIIGHLAIKKMMKTIKILYVLCIFKTLLEQLRY